LYVDLKIMCWLQQVHARLLAELISIAHVAWP
jgi:hypothetical protein